MSEDTIELKPLPKGHLSSSQMTTYAICPKKYEFLYVEGRRLPPQGYLVNGTATHEALDADMGQKIGTKENLLTEQVMEVFADKFEKTVEIAKDKFGGVEWEKEDKGKVKDTGIGALRLYHKENAKNINPKEVEKEMTIEFQNSDLKLLVKPDVVTENGSILDWKTAQKDSQTAVPPPQLGYYQLAQPETVFLRIDTLIRTKEPKYRIQVYSANSGDQQRKLLADMSAIEKSIRAGLFPRTGHIWGYMICRGCAFQRECWGQKVTYDLPKLEPKLEKSVKKVKRKVIAVK